MLRQKYDVKPKREVIIWLDREGIPYKRYQNLSSNDKAVLHNLVCVPTRTTSENQRRNLYKNLCLPDTGGKKSIDPVDFIPPEELERFFTPIKPSETLTDYEKY